MRHGLVQVYTGNGKGKTTAALGLALRALGAGLKVYLGQFIKKGDYSEIKALRRFKPNIVIRQYGSGRFINGKPSPAEVENAKKGLADLIKAMLSGKYDVIIADEIFCAANRGLIKARELKRLLEKKTVGVELVLTGRNAPRRVIKQADLVTEMRKIKHPFDCGECARKGIEF